MFSIKNLNEIQLKITKDTEGAILVSAGAGSGKTRLLTHRICYLISEKKISPSNILAITFTNKAANEMKERIFSLIPNASGIWISTIHSMCVKILRENIGRLEGYTRFFSICDEADKEKILKKIIKDKEINKDNFLNKISWHISEAKNQGLGYVDYCKSISYIGEVEDIFNVFMEYEKQLKDSNCLDFDDLILKTLEIFETLPDVLAYYQEKFKYIHVDEFQDTNIVQYNIIKLLSKKNKNIFVVGDEDQCIYTWRGANIENIKNFLSDFADCKLYKLEQNYRSTKNIIEKANKLIQHNISRIEKNLFTENEEGELITYHSARDEFEEAEFVSRTIYNLVESGVPHNQITVLMRISSLSRLIEEKLLNYNIPFVVSGIFKFFDRVEVKNILAYFRVLSNNLDNISLARIINYPKRSIGNVTINKLLAFAAENNISLYKTIVDYQLHNLPNSIKIKVSGLADILVKLQEIYEEGSISNLMKELLELTQILSFYDRKVEEDLDRLKNIEQLYQSIATFEQSNPSCTLTDYLESVTLQNSMEEAEDTTQSVNISTIHASKGLEYDNVFIIGMEEGCFPSSRAMDNPDNLEEERRLMYVAVTRARKKLFLTRAKSRAIYGERKFSIESRFLKEMGRAPKKTHSKKTLSSEEDRVSTEEISKSINRKISSELSTIGKRIANNASKIEEYTIGTKVLHIKFGIGVVKSIEENGENSYLNVEFDKIGIKKLSIGIAPIKIIKDK